MKTATLVDVLIQYKDEDNTPIETRVGVVEGGLTDEMFDTDLDNSVFFWFDDMSEIVVGADMGDDIIVGIESEPYTEEFVLLRNLS